MKVRNLWKIGVVMLVFAVAGCGADNVKTASDQTVSSNFEYEPDEEPFKTGESGQPSEQDAFDKAVFESATSTEELVVGVKMSEAIQYVKLQQIDDCFYLFLPAAATQIQFVNTGDNSNLKIDDREVKDVLLELDSQEWIWSSKKIFFAKQESPICVMKSANIPSVFIDTEVMQDELDSQKGVEYPADMEVVKADGCVDYSGSLDYIRARGNTTFGSYKKKPYQIKTSKKYAALGMNKAKKWILLAGESDNTYLWNSLVYDFAREYSDIPAADGEFVDLYINGVYRGNYYLCQKVDVNTGLLELEDLEEANEGSAPVEGVEHFGYDSSWTAKGVVDRKTPQNYTGGYLLEYLPLYQLDTAESSFYLKNDRAMDIKYPGQATLDEVLYIKDLFEKIETAISTPSGVNPLTGKHYTDYLDVDSFIEKFLMDSVFANSDSITSVFFYKNCDERDGKVYAGPIWDYDKAYSWDFSVEAVEAYQESYICAALAKREDFMQRARIRYEKVYKPYIKYYLCTDIYEKVRLLYKSFQMNNVCWGTPKLHNSLESFVDTMVQRCNDRLKVVDSIVFGDETSSVHQVVFAGGNAASTEYRIVEDGATIENIPVGVSYNGVFVRWKRSDTGEYLYYNTPIYEDVVYEAEYLPLEILILNAEEISGYDVNNLVPEQFEYIADYIRKQQKSNSVK